MKMEQIHANKGNFLDISMAGAILDNKVQVTKISGTKSLLITLEVIQQKILLEL
jgi:hypothetical protein